MVGFTVGFSRVSCAFSILLLALCPACREEVKPPEIVSLSGRIVDIDIGGRRISLLYYNEKYEQEMTKTGDVCEDTEILINGVLATLADLRVGESVRGQVRVEGKEPNKELRELTVLRIIVDRPATIATPPHASVAATGSADNRKAQDRP